MSLAVSSTVRVMDVSESGMLLGCPVGVPLGTRGRLRTMLARGRLDVQVEVRRRQPIPADEPKRQNYAIGVTFLSPEAQAQRILRGLLKADF
jgi:hypothetical protein